MRHRPSGALTGLSILVRGDTSTEYDLLSDVELLAVRIEPRENVGNVSDRHVYGT